MEDSIAEPRAMDTAQKEKFSDEELEEIMDRRGPEEALFVKEIREAIRESPLLMAGLAFTFGLLVGVSLRSQRRK